MFTLNWLASFLATVVCTHFLYHVSAQFPPEPEGIKVLKSKFHEGITISYKEPEICETTPGVRSYSGYVHLPPNSIDEPGQSQDYPINTFFWFFESRKDPHDAPLSIWLNGGPGGSSLMGALSENGPCFVNNDSNSTYLNPWSWSNEVNLLYIDQPVQVGYSYDTPTNITVNLLGKKWSEPDVVERADFSDGVPVQNSTFYVGRTGSLNMTNTANSTNHAAVAMWHFAQTWFEEFPAYKPNDEKISLFTESYGGKYGPAFMSYFMRQNELIANGTLQGPGAHYIHLDSLGIINGCIDDLYRNRGYITFPWNNTYGIKAINETQYHQAMYELDRPGGIQDQIGECQRLAMEADPNEYGDIEKVNKFCSSAREYAENFTTRPYLANGNNGWYDISHRLFNPGDPFPPEYLNVFLNQHWVQKALGVPVNHTASSETVHQAFTSTGDMARGGLLEDIAYLLDSGVKVALVYGDRDFACNWVGGEESSLHIDYSSSESFRSAGYTPLEVNPFYSGGQTRQYGNLSFTRVYQAGHLVPAYQPEAAYKIFMRTLFNKDIATGTIDLTDDYSTKGPSSTWQPSDVLSPPEPECFIRNPATCTEEQWEAVKNGTAIVKDWIVVGIEKEEGERKAAHARETAESMYVDSNAQKILHRAGE